jgi:predicted ester cyclase
MKLAYYTVTSSSNSKRRTDMSQDLKARYNEYVDVIWNQKNLAALDKYFDPDHVDHDAPPGQAPGLAGLKPIFAMMQAAFPDWHIEVEQLLEVGDTVVARIRSSGTHRGNFFGIPATGRSFTSTSTHILRYRDGKMSEHWGNADDLGMMQQLGVIKMPGQ